MPKYVFLGEGTLDKNWNFIEDDEELKKWVEDGSLKDDDLIVEIKSIKKAVKKSHIELEITSDVEK